MSNAKAMTGIVSSIARKRSLSWSGRSREGPPDLLSRALRDCSATVLTPRFRIRRSVIDDRTNRSRFGNSWSDLRLLDRFPLVAVSLLHRYPELPPFTIARAA